MHEFLLRFEKVGRGDDTALLVNLNLCGHDFEGPKTFSGELGKVSVGLELASIFQKLFYVCIFSDTRQVLSCDFISLLAYCVRLPVHHEVVELPTRTSVEICGDNEVNSLVAGRVLEVKLFERQHEEVDLSEFDISSVIAEKDVCVSDQDETVWVLEVLYSRDYSDIIFSVNRAREVLFLIAHFVFSNKFQLRCLHQCAAPVTFVSVFPYRKQIIAQFFQTLNKLLVCLTKKIQLL